MDFKELEWKIGRRHFIVKIKNVHELNPEAQIQMCIEISEQSKRTKFFCVDVPASKVDDFLEALK